MITIKTNVAVAKLRTVKNRTSAYIVFNVDTTHIGYIEQHDDGNWQHSRSFQKFTSKRGALENLQRAVA